MINCQEARNAITILEVECPQCGDSVEVFVNDGEQTMTAWIYTPQSADGITFAADSKAVITAEQFELDL